MSDDFNERAGRLLLAYISADNAALAAFNRGYFDTVVYDEAMCAARIFADFCANQLRKDLDLPKKAISPISFRVSDTVAAAKALHPKVDCDVTPSAK